jgi:hypothetical protein
MCEQREPACTKTTVANRILGILQKALVALSNSLDFDGMDLSEIIEDIERKWDIKTDEFQFGSDATVGDLAQIIAVKANVTMEDVVHPLIEILGDRMSRDSARILTSSRLIRDLGIG